MLKIGTLSLHRQAEAALESRAGIETSEGLTHFLSCMLKAHSKYQTECDQAARLAGLKARSETLISALLTDLRIPESIGPLSTNHNEYFCLGVGYVFEGSALGANILMKRLIASNLVPPTYLSLLTLSAKSRWPRYIDKLDTCKDEDIILAGAIDAFEFIIAQAELTHDVRD